MSTLTSKELLTAGVHFGHLRKKWNPKMAPYIFMERKGIHLIDLNKTVVELEKAGNAMRSLAKSGKKILFVATKKQAKDMVKGFAQKANMPFVTERWLGGMLTNFSTIRKSVKRMQSIDKLMEEDSITKKEKLMLAREKAKMDRVLGGIAGLNRIPAAIFIVDTVFEHIALAESTKLGLTTFGMVDTNADPTAVNFAIPANDDASKSIEVITNYLVGCIIEGLNERKSGGNDVGDVMADGDVEVRDSRERRTRGRKRKNKADVEKENADLLGDAKQEKQGVAANKKAEAKDAKATPAATEKPAVQKPVETQTSSEATTTTTTTATPAATEKPAETKTTSTTSGSETSSSDSSASDSDSSSTGGTVTRITTRRIVDGVVTETTTEVVDNGDDKDA